MKEIRVFDFYIDKQPEKYFLAALLQRAITDAFGEPKMYRTARGNHYAISPDIKADAVEWLYSDDSREGSAQWACEALGLCRKSLISRAENEQIKPNYRNRAIW